MANLKKIYHNGTAYNIPVTSVNNSTGDVTVQETLVSGTNIKTINNTSLLGSGNIDIQSGGNYTAGNGIDITNDEIGLDGTYEGEGGKDYSAMQGPAPTGFHVPLSSEWQSIIDMLTTLGLITEDKSLSDTNLLTYLKASGSGYLDKDKGNTVNLNSKGCTYWCCDKYTDKVGYSYYFSSSDYSMRVYNNVQSMAYAIRAFKDISTVPDNTWTTLYDGSSIATGAGIFHNASLGLISISSNGNMYITIQDKDIGASSVWNYGDTKDNNNCGKKFQRGNNYGFPRQNATSTSSTQVDATNYGPGNYYNSTTFITQSGRTSWDSSDNGNLWGGETGIVQKTISGNLVIGDKLYKIVTSTTAPASGTASNIITFVTD